MAGGFVRQVLRYFACAHGECRASAINAASHRAQARSAGLNLLPCDRVRLSGVKTPGEIMTARRVVLMAISLAVALVAPAARAADPSAQSFVQAIYDQYKGKDAKGVELTDNAAVRR
jgi:hypothetical protein